jgi:hypothetical protein
MACRPWVARARARITSQGLLAALPLRRRAHQVKLEFVSSTPPIMVECVVIIFAGGVGAVTGWAWAREYEATVEASGEALLG